MSKHYLKSWAHFFDAIKDGRKVHDLRKMDRDYKVGDILVLQRYDNINGVYTGEEIEREITYITSEKVPCAFSSSALEKGYCILSLKELKSPIAKETEEVVDLLEWLKYVPLYYDDKNPKRLRSKYKNLDTYYG